MIGKWFFYFLIQIYILGSVGIDTSTKNDSTALETYRESFQVGQGGLESGCIRPQQNLMKIWKLNTPGQGGHFTTIPTTATRRTHTHTHKYFYFFAENFSKWLKHMLNAMLLRIITVAHCEKLPWLHKRIIFDLAKHFLWLSSYLLSYYLHFRAKKNFIWSDVFVCTKQRGKTVAWVSYLPNLNIQGICY